MNGTLDDLYLTWLYSQVGSVRDRRRNKTFWSLLRILYGQQFVWFVFNDDNRAADGQQLRSEFIREEGLLDVDPCWLELECSVLEMIIALSRRLSFQAGGEPRTWFWHLIDNLDLHHFNDRDLPGQEDYVREIVDRLVYRTYQRTGHGGLFPLKRNRQDQRRVEIWYQMHAYLLENY